MSMSIKERELALVEGRWGGAEPIRQAAREWFAGAGIGERAVLDAHVHPLAHFKAEARRIDPSTRSLQPEILASSAPAPRIADRTLGTSIADLKLAEIVETRISPDTIVQLDAAEVGVLQAAADILAAVIPQLSEDVLQYVQKFVVSTRKDMVGETWMEYPGLILFGRPAFKDPATLAESLLHESLHSKTVWLERGMADLGVALDETAADADDKPIPVPWRRNEDGSVVHWSTVRTFDAFYVYAHLTVLSGALWEARNGDADIEHFRRTCFRAAYLSNQIRNSPKCAGIGEGRHEVARWLDTIRVEPFDLTIAGAEQLAAVA